MTKGSTAMRSAAVSDFIGLDLSDKTAAYVVLSAEGEVVRDGKLKLSPAGLQQALGTRPPAQIAIEVGGHSPWVSRTLTDMGYAVTVANPRQVKLISHGQKKNDLLDAENLARLLRYDPAMLRPVQHRGPTAQADLALLRGRDALVRARTRLINSARSMVKAAGGRLLRCSAESFHYKVHDDLPELLKPALEPMLEAIAGLTEQIRASEKQLKKLADERYPETRILRQIKGVGPLTSLGFVLTLEEPQRFSKSRSAGAFLGLTPRQYDSGESQPQLRITKAGDPFLRRLVVQSAQYMLGPFGEACDLRRWGLKLAGSGKNKIRRNKAVVAVARKLAVLLHRLWLTGEVYEPLRHAAPEQEAA
jgi:transposase